MVADVPEMCKNALFTMDLLILSSDLHIYATEADEQIRWQNQQIRGVQRFFAHSRDIHTHTYK